ncbi:MAG: hypothetical protein HQL57_07905 [Magnetococcales bacterium]|nr:hypothetical protein [Magnetococcales bacterium]MBF0157090.1 hypothetical protein [Magnetococcales bacterium]
MRERVLSEDEKLVKEVIRETKRPSGVVGVDYAFGEDHDGDPIVRIDVLLEKDETQPTPERVGVLRAFSSTLRDRLLDDGIGPWPHVFLSIQGGRH